MPLKSKAIIFTGQRQVDLIETEVPNPSAGEFTIQTLNTLMSMGTEMFCYRGESDVGSHWMDGSNIRFIPAIVALDR